ncbi:1-acyl-sn-glycerol-3-phosphate acyltransferase [Marinilabiliaceae bacterium JC017]|nr:1-acyl-sn-glycerol-3-phosphate acyltransferase [Marinilabiliaceae bacterium JC017]
MNKAGYLLYQPYKWLIYVPVMIVNTIFCSIMAALTSIVVSPRIGSFFGVLWARISSLVTPMLVSVKGKENISPKQSYVVVSNHQSAYDIFILYGWLGVDFKWIMKKELRKAPGIGYASAKVGHIFLDRSSPRAAIESIQHAKAKLVNGTSVVVFPEGTRSRSSQMRRFKKGAFKLAYELDLPILPLTIVDSHRIMRKGFLNVVPGRAKLIIHHPINIDDYKDNPEGLIESTRRTIESGLLNN